MRDLNEVQVGGDWYERRRARATQINIIKKMQAILKKYEAEDGNWSRRRGFPTFNDLEIMKEQIKLEQMADRK
jgi:hypothetical protein